MVGFGENLKDQISDINNYTLNGIQLMKDVRDFIAERLAIEQHYATNMDKLAKNYQKKFKKSHQSFYGAGSSFVLPIPEPGDPQSTIAQAWTKLISETENAAKTRHTLCEGIQKEVLEHLKFEIKRKEEARIKHMNFHQVVTTNLEICKAESEKARASYRSAGKDLDSSYQNYEKAKDEKSADKTKKEWNEYLIKKIDRKNEYSLSIDAYNAQKKKYYYTDVPKIMDHMQDLNEHVIQRVREIMTEYVEFDDSCLKETLQCNQSIISTVSAINPSFDTEYFMKSVQKPWNCPNDILFEPFSTSDNSQLSVEPSDVWLLNNLQRLLQDLEKQEQDVSTQKKTIEGILNLRDAYQKDPSLGDFIEVWQNFIESERELILKETEQTKTKVLIDSTHAATGEIQLKPHSYTKSTQNGNCDVCLNSFSLFSKGSVCAECKFKCHTGCMVKVAPRCGTPYIAPFIIGPTSAGVSLARTSSLLTTKSSTSVSLKSYLGQVKMLYDYSKQNDGDLNVKEGDIIDVLEFDDGNGWLRGVYGGVEGVVPANYVEKVDSSARRPSATTTKVKALYDYQANDKEELNLKVGDVIIVLNKNVGGGWWEGELNGKVGIFPENYVEPIH